MDTNDRPEFFEARHNVEHFYKFAQFGPGVRNIVSPYDENIQVKSLTITVTRVDVSDDMEIDTDYLDVTVQGKGFKFKKNGKPAAMASHFYANTTEVEANPWLAKLVEYAKREAQA